YFRGDVPVTRPLTRAEVEQEYERHTGLVIVETFGTLRLAPAEVPAVLVANHGPFTWGADPLAAVEAARVLEHLALLAYLTRGVGLAGAGATSGVALAHYELHAWCLLVLGWVMVPFYARTMVFTMPEFLERRFSPTNRYVLSLITLVAHVVTKFAVGIFAGGVVFGVLLPELRLDLAGYTFNSFWIGSVIVVIMTGLYTVLGGMRAVAYTDALQTVILVAGSGLLTLYGLKAL